MPILVMCSNAACGELFDAPDEAAGEVLRCPACGTAQRITSTGVTESVSDEFQVAPPPQPPSQAAAPVAPKVPPTEGPEALPALDLSTTDTQHADEPVRGGRQRSKAQLPERDVSDETFDLTPVDEGPPASGVSGAARAAPPGAPAGQGPGTHESAGPSPQADQEDDIIEELLPITGDQALQFAQPQETPDEGVMENSLASAIILTAGLLGLAVGVAIALKCFGGHWILAVYMGAAIGWATGFVGSFLLVLSAERGEGGKTKCTYCGNVQASDATICGWCGADLSTQTVHPLAADCLAAMSYAVGNRWGVVWTVLLITLGALVISSSYYLSLAFPVALGPWTPALIALCAIVAFGVFSNCMEFFFDAIRQTIACSNDPPSAPTPLALQTLGAGFKGLAVLLVYFVPIVTIPLLPLAVVCIGFCRLRQALNPVWALRMVCRHAKEYSILWLLLLMWSSALTLGVAIAVGTLRARRLIGALEPQPQAVLDIVASTVGAAVLGVAGVLFGLTLFRCFGLFGRHNARSLLGQAAMTLRAGARA